MQASGRSRKWKWLFWLLIVPALLFALYVWFVISWSYSTGERAGYIQKFSHRGWLCKTWEGEIALITMPGTVAEKFFFTVRDDAVAARINASMGQRVTVTYNQHIGIPTDCFGDTQYFVTDVKVVSDPSLLFPPPAPAKSEPAAASPAPAPPSTVTDPGAAPASPPGAPAANR